MAYVITDECVACGTCLDECESDAIEEGEEKYKIDQDKCTECGNCVESCPTEAIVEE
ncbi:4Fe-4S binding protein [bacterium]|nr:4Fe-4S binding protein [bacterium]